MSESTKSAVECPVCGEEFDPTDAGGWCTNPECGEWQYIGNEVPDPSDDAGDDADLQNDAGDADAGDADAGDADAGDADDADGEDADATGGTTAEAEDEAERGAGDEAESESEDDERDAEPTPAIRRIDESDEPEAAESAESTADAESAGSTAGSESADESDAVACPACGADADPGDNFCADCGAALEATEQSTLDACPECGTDVDEEDSFCASCGEDLDAAREALAGTGQAQGDATAQAGASGRTAESLVLRTRGEEIVVTADETLGREVRRILTRTGADEDEAVRIHREHVRFVREDDQFHLVDLGDNPTVLNGRYLSKGDREPVGPGDEIELSDVVTLSVESP